MAGAADRGSGLAHEGPPARMLLSIEGVPVALFASFCTIATGSHSNGEDSQRDARDWHGGRC